MTDSYPRAFSMLPEFIDLLENSSLNSAIKQEGRSVSSLKSSEEVLNYF